MLNSPWHDNEFTGPYQFFMVPEFHAQLALHHKKHFVLIVMVMPYKFTGDFHSLDVAVIYLTQDLRAPELVELREFLRDIYGVHHEPPVQNV